MPLINSGLGRTLTIGRGASVYYDRQPICTWGEHLHEVTQILISIDPVDAIVNWNLRGEQHRAWRHRAVHLGVTVRDIWRGLRAFAMDGADSVEMEVRPDGVLFLRFEP